MSTIIEPVEVNLEVTVEETKVISQPDEKIITSACGVSSFTSLKDTPGTYIGKGGKFLRVSIDEQKLEFVELDNSSDFLWSMIFS